MSIGEFDLISKYFNRHSFANNSSKKANPFGKILLGVGDDAALIPGVNGSAYAVSVDSLVEGQHFFANAAAADLGYKALAIALSDLAAMGAKPHSALLSLTLPQADALWLQDFSDNFYALASKFDVQLIGGNTTAGPLNISTTVFGSVAEKFAMQRSAARVDDLIFVAGNLGFAAAGLAYFSQKSSQVKVNKNLDEFINAWLRPNPLCFIGELISPYANAAIDVSDGFLADLQHILSASGNLGAKVYVEKLPGLALLLSCFAKQQSYDYALNGGEDYALCFTVPKAQAQLLISAWEKQALALKVEHKLFPTLHCVGNITASNTIEVLDASGATVSFSNPGWQHF